MTDEFTDARWLDSHHEISFAELLECSGVSAEELRELVEHGALVPTNPQSVEWTFTGNCIVTVRTAQRLRNDFDLEPHALALALTFVERIRELEAELCELRAQLPRRVR
jgi:chaperone modulatory protein CbpM